MVMSHVAGGGDVFPSSPLDSPLKKNLLVVVLVAVVIVVLVMFVLKCLC